MPGETASLNHIHAAWLVPLRHNARGYFLFRRPVWITSFRYPGFNPVRKSARASNPGSQRPSRNGCGRSPARSKNLTNLQIPWVPPSQIGRNPPAAASAAICYAEKKNQNKKGENNAYLNHLRVDHHHSDRIGDHPVESRRSGPAIPHQIPRYFRWLNSLTPYRPADRFSLKLNKTGGPLVTGFDLYSLSLHMNPSKIFFKQPGQYPLNNSGECWGCPKRLSITQ